MYKLDKCHYDKINPMINRKISSNAFLSVIDGYNPGEIFIDSIENPLTAVIWSKGIAGFGIIGDVLSKHFTNNFVLFVDEYMIPFLKKQGHTSFEVNCINETLNHSFCELISVKQFHKWEQNLYYYDVGSINSGYENLQKVYLVDSYLLSSRLNTNLIEETISQYWHSIDEFLLKGIGYCCVEDNIAVSLSYSSFLSDSYYEVGIETLSDYRRKGYAYAAACSVLNEILLRGKEPFWECSAHNIASAKTAEKLGFKKKSVYTCFGFNIE